MSVVTYSLKIHGGSKLTANFTVKEFRCKDGSDTVFIDTDLVDLLQEIRDAFGKPITINSAYRTPTYNKKIGGASASQHVKGKAADIRIAGVPPAAIAAWMEKHIKAAGKHACGYYPISQFCHVDVRDKATMFQEYKKSKTKSVSSFGFGSKYDSYWNVQKSAESEEEDDEMVTERPVNIFGKDYTAKGILKDGSNYLSPRIFEEAGLSVGSQGSTPIISTGSIKVKSGDTTKQISGFISNGTTYCGLRQLLEMLGHEVEYDSAEGAVVVK